MVDFRDDELKKWLAEEYEREIDEMEKVLFPDGILPDDGETEEEAKEAYQRLVARLKADGVYEEDEEENDSKEADDHKADTNKKIVYLPEKKHHKLARVAAVVLVCAAGVFAAGMTSQANRSYFIDSVKMWTGNDTSISIDNDTTSDEADRDEQSAISDIENQMGFDKIPRFLYRPENFKYKDYLIYSNTGVALMEYCYGKSIITVYISDYRNNSKTTDYVLDGRIINSLKIKDEKFEIEIRKIKDKHDKKENYIAYWKTDTAFYQISGNMEEKEFIKLIENIRF
ncbi:DUF4367 domain-containing protein [Blautia sp. MSJ-36]|uniref:DUF4367 domain-containing protein n=1 Tax=Blautia sp. MSJ-36 TaxID=2841530 RepID=UPI001C11DB52|nr:DUF4367 domain-containing protein [Blautia sp. MSJ-36]MBU5446157.1 DUF4367 domain-containing protein [Blautia sp. MSJ-36]